MTLDHYDAYGTSLMDKSTRFNYGKGDNFDKLTDNNKLVFAINDREYLGNPTQEIKRVYYN